MNDYLLSPSWQKKNLQHETQSNLFLLSCVILKLICRRSAITRFEPLEEVLDWLSRQGGYFQNSPEWELLSPNLIEKVLFKIRHLNSAKCTTGFWIFSGILDTHPARPWNFLSAQLDLWIKRPNNPKRYKSSSDPINVECFVSSALMEPNPNLKRKEFHLNCVSFCLEAIKKGLQAGI